MSNGSDTTNSVWRYRVLALIGGLCLAAMLAQLAWLQLARGAYYRRRAERQSVRMLWIPAVRGTIHDRTLDVLADNRPAFDIDLNIRELGMRARTNVIRQLAVLLRQPESNLWSALISPQRFPYEPARVASDVSLNAMTRVAEQLDELPAVDITVNPVRSYSYARSACHLLGYVGKVPPNHPGLLAGEYSMNDWVGVSGIERVCERALHGDNGRKLVQVDRTSRYVDTIEQKPPVPGQNVVLTIDAHLQSILERALSNHVGAAVAIDPNNGDVLALVSSPGFDPGLFAGRVSAAQYTALLADRCRPLFNRAIAGQYPLGSVFKLITSIAGLESGVISSNTVFQDPGVFQLGAMRVRNFRRLRHGEVDLLKALRVSCNTFFCNYAVPIGITRLNAAAQLFHLGDKTGIELPEEAAGLLPDPIWKRSRLREPWFPGDTVNLSIGHGYLLVTPLQVAAMVAAIANGGVWYPPRLIRGYEINHRLVLAHPPAHGEFLPLTAGTLPLVQQGMWEVVNHPLGSGRLAAVPGLTVAGKTGSAQTPAQTYGWFVCYAPFHQPTIALAILVEHAETGGKDAAPIARNALAAYFNIDLSRHTNPAGITVFSD